MPRRIDGRGEFRLTARFAGANGPGHPMEMDNSPKVRVI